METLPEYATQDSLWQLLIARKSEATEGFTSRRSRLQKFCETVFAAFSVYVVFSVAYRTSMLATSSLKVAWVTAVALTVAALFSYSKRSSIRLCLRAAFPHLPYGSRTWFWTVLGVGMLVRLIWIAVYHSTLKSDGAAYFDLAARLANGKETGSFWPPGLGILEAPFVHVLGLHLWVAYLCTVLLFAASYGATYLLAASLGSRREAGIAVSVVAFWPTLVALSSANSKEYLVLFLVSAAGLLYVRSLRGKQPGERMYAPATGLAIGGAALCQPGFLLYPAIFFLCDRLIGVSWLRSLARLCVVVLTTLAAIAPWTYHNYRAYHRFVLISSNGGSVFYRANNPRANASYSADEDSVLPKDVFEADAVGYKLGKDWIKHHPIDFARLAIRKQVNFLGDDGIGPYESMKRDRQVPLRGYNFAKFICQATWLMAWWLLLLYGGRVFGSLRWSAVFGIAFLPFLYQLAIDSVFESGGRHHVGYTGLLGLLIAMSVASHARPRSTEHEPPISIDSARRPTP